MTLNTLPVHKQTRMVWALAGCCLAGLASQRPLEARPSGQETVVFRDLMGVLPLQDPRVATFDRQGSPTLDVDTGSSVAGWSLRLNGVDWSEYRGGQLAIRIRFSEKTLRRFKVVVRGDGETLDSCPAYRVNLRADDIGPMRRRGFGDVLIPLGQVAGPGSLRRVVELMLVFGSDRAGTVDAAPGKAQLAIHSIRLIPPKKAETRPARELLDDLAVRAFSWFETYRDPTSGLVPDRAPNWRCAGPAEDTRTIPCSIASVGYYLSMLPDAVKTQRLSEAQACQRAVLAMRFLETNAEQHAGLLHHFLDMKTGKPVAGSEVSVLDSAILFNGCMVASVYFGGEVKDISDRLLARLDWHAFLVPGEAGRPELLAMGWEPQRGVYGPIDVRSSELAMACFLAIGAQAKGVDQQVWRDMAVKTGQVEGQTILNPTHGLFTSYYGLGWHMLEGRLDPDGVDLWQNARAAAIANRAFCRAARDQTYQWKWGGWWGISAGDSPRGYIAPGPVANDAGGTVWPTAALAALPWASREIGQDLEVWAKSPVWQYVTGPYGLAPFNLQEGWIGTDLIGIDLGSFYLAVANLRRATVWDLWRQHPIARRAMERIYGDR